MTLTTPARARPTSGFRWVPAAAGWVVGVIATLSLLASISPLIRSAIKVPREFVNDYIFNFPDTSFAWAFVLALLAAALAARKRLALWILVGYMVAAVGWNIADLAEGGERWFQEVGELIGLAFHLAAIVFLLLARKQFWAKVRRGALLKAAAVLVAAMGIGTLIGWALLEAFPGSLARPDRFWYALNRVSAFAGADADSFSGHPHVFVNALLGLFGALALMVAAIVLFQSQRAENALTGEDESAIRGLLELYGKNDSLGYFATRRDKAVVFAPNGRAAITYRVEVGVCLASGDPVGDPKAWPHAIEAWLALCQSYGWAPGVMGASSTGAQAFRAAGLNALQLGDEAILHPDSFRLSGPDMRAVRQAVTRARRAGASVRIRRHRDIGTDEMAQVVARADAWRDTDDERGFSMALGRLGDPADGDCLLVEAVQNEHTVAMLSLVPWGTNGASLDLMRRSPQSPNGSIELMVSAGRAPPGHRSRASGTRWLRPRSSAGTSGSRPVVEVVSELAGMDEPRRLLAGIISGLAVHYDLGGGAPPARAPHARSGPGGTAARPAAGLRAAARRQAGAARPRWSPAPLTSLRWADRVQRIDAQLFRPVGNSGPRRGHRAHRRLDPARRDVALGG